jgi:uncharacterized protein YggE
MRNKIRLVLSVVLITASLTACGGVAAAKSSYPADTPEPPPANRTIRVSGSGRAVLSPNIAYVNIGVHTESKDAVEAVTSNNIQTQKVTDALVDAGIDEKDIQTTNFSIYPRQDYDSQGKPTGEITYIVENSVHVTVRDLDQIGEILNTAVQAGANTIHGIQFDVSDKTEALSEARQSAVANAETVAEELAQAAGVELGEIQTISTFSGGFPAPMVEGRGGGAALMADVPVPVSPGQMIVTVEVSMIYAIE